MGEKKYIKSIDGCTLQLSMLYAVIQRFTSKWEIKTFMTAEVRTLYHEDIGIVPSVTRRVAYVRCEEKFFEGVYRNLYDLNIELLSSD